jgi:hypothetical protein
MGSRKARSPRKGKGRQPATSTARARLPAGSPSLSDDQPVPPAPRKPTPVRPLFTPLPRELRGQETVEFFSISNPPPSHQTIPTTDGFLNELSRATPEDAEGTSQAPDRPVPDQPRPEPPQPEQPQLEQPQPEQLRLRLPTIRSVERRPTLIFGDPNPFNLPQFRQRQQSPSPSPSLGSDHTLDEFAKQEGIFS